jgi:hypothetical protein
MDLETQIHILRNKIGLVTTFQNIWTWRWPYVTFAARFRDAARKITVCASVRVCGLVEKMQGISELLERFFSILK